MIEEIKSLYPQIKGKTKFLIEVAPKFGLRPISLRNHWVSPFWSIPKHHQEQFLNEIKKKIDAQKEINHYSIHNN